MRVLITGVAGFIGAATAQRLLAENHTVVGVDCLLPVLTPVDEKCRRLKQLDDSPAFEFHRVDLRDGGVGPLLSGTDSVIHFAALPGLLHHGESAEQYRQCNVSATRNLLSALVDHPGAHLLHASTSSVYGAVAVGNEDAELRPVSVYGETKLEAERLIGRFRHEAGVTASILRFFSVYGPGQRSDMAYAIACARLLEDEPFTVTGDGSQTRSNTYIDDAVDAVMRALDQRIDGAVLNISGSEEISLLDAVTVLADEIGVTPRIERRDSRPGDQGRTHGDSSRARALLGWEPRTPIEVGLRRQMAHAATQRF